MFQEAETMDHNTQFAGQQPGTQTARFGAHETIEVHEILNGAIDVINRFQLYRPHVQDGELQLMLDRQMQFAISEYNTMVQLLQGKGMGHAVPYQGPKNVTPVYGLRNPQPYGPQASAQQLDDRDVAVGMLCAHKSSAVHKMTAALECADPNIRRMLQQSAVNCAEQAYEVWQYMNQRGYYQVPTMMDMTTQTMIRSFAETPNQQPQ
jgi:spore coat protein CotF